MKLEKSIIPRFFLPFILFIFVQFLDPLLLQGQSASWMANAVFGLFQNAPWKLGPIRAYRSFSLGNAGYDSDIYYGFRDEEYPDFTFTAGPSFQWLVPLKKTIFVDSLQQVQGAFYAKNEKERAFNFQTNNKIHFLFKKFYGQTALNYENSRRRFSPELILNIREERLTWESFMLWQFSRRGAVAWQVRTSRYNYLNTEYEGISLERELGRRESYFETFLYYQPNPKFRLFLNGQLGFFSFTRLESKIKDSRSYGFLGGLEFNPEASPQKTAFEGRLSLGYVYLDPKNPGTPVASDIVGNGFITINLTHWLSLRSYFSRNFNVSIYSTLLHYLSTTYGGGFNFRLSQKISLGNNLLLGQASYSIKSQAQETVPTYKFATLSTNLAIKLGKEWNFILFGNLSQRKVLPTELNLNRYFIGFSLTFGMVPGGNILPVPSLL